MFSFKVRNLEIGDGSPKICVPIVGQSKTEILQMAQDSNKTAADLIEWRADWFTDVQDLKEVQELLCELRAVIQDRPLVFTFRTKCEGGQMEIGEDEYERLNQLAVDSGCVDFIDVEVFSMFTVAESLITYAKQKGVKVIGSNHDFCKTPTQKDIVGRLRQMQEMDVDVPKIAVMPQTKEDVLTLLSATWEMSTNYADRPIVTMSMGELGMISRVAGQTVGSAITFATVGKESAPGQLHVNEMSRILEMLSYKK